MGYGGFKDLTRRKTSDKIWRDKALQSQKIRNMMDINVDLFQCFAIYVLLRVQINLLVLVLKMKISQAKN